ncbi:hypothetical protein FNW52_02120 [Flavobacterium sp. ZT3R18]|uniref:hypothetical protein n=1 Tax=Flavobacterium sp. ZT3R18 TaxID=2594429 RepID=UPI00117ABC61|nr:hypothetical protein [Flavobacterium sp. ZT3R18]TRX38862.1 hypothetical protein FNW52_02120 [Flavobacterium sp. ZT3R18]
MNNELKVILQEKSGEKKNKKIEDISKKLQKIEKLNADFVTLNKKIKTIRELVDEKTTNTKKLLCQTIEKFIILLIKKYGMKSFAKWEKETIAGIINEELETLANYDYKSETLQNAIDQFITFQKENMSKYEKELAQESYKLMMDEFDLDFEEGDLDFDKINDPAFKKQFEEKIRAKQKEQQDRQKQFEKEQKIEKTDIDFQKIYKKLAKLAHPDLYKSESEKAVKEEQMQRLTKAWDERDYYELLMLWLEIDPENTIELEITEKNQKNIIAQLNKKITEIEAETYRVKFHFGDTAFYYQFNAPSEKGINTKIEKYKKTLDKNSEMTALKHIDVEKTKTFKIILNEIYESNQQDDFDDFLTNFGMDFDED